MSLKMQAISFLSRREHSRQELRVKLLAALRKRQREDAALAAASEALADELAASCQEPFSNGIDEAFGPRPATPSGVVAASALNVGLADGDAQALEPSDPESAVDELLDWLVAHKYLSDTRFVESRVHARASRQGASMIRHELAQHGLALDPEQASALRATEFSRAQALWQRRFGDVAQDVRERARQARFLVSRGFASDVVRKIVGGMDEE